MPDLIQKPELPTRRKRAAPIGALLFLLVTIAFVVVNLPDIRRYMRIRNM